MFRGSSMLFVMDLESSIMRRCLVLDETIIFCFAMELYILQSRCERASKSLRRHLLDTTHSELGVLIEIVEVTCSITEGIISPSKIWPIDDCNPQRRFLQCSHENHQGAHGSDRSICCKDCCKQGFSSRGDLRWNIHQLSITAYI